MLIDLHICMRNFGINDVSKRINIASVNVVTCNSHHAAMVARASYESTRGSRHTVITWQDEIFHVYWYPLRLCVCLCVCVCVCVCVCICVSSKNVSEFVRSLASRVLEIS